MQGLQELARAPANRYALGWITHAMQGAGWLLHTGETGGFQALSLVAMDGSRAAFAHSNIATEDSSALLYEGVSVLLA